MTTGTMDITDRKLLNIIQTEFPVVEEPYRAVAEQLGIAEADVLERLAELKRQNVVRQVSAIFDTRRLGLQDHVGGLSLMPTPTCTAEQYLIRHPGVSHNYAREGSYYNLWFTLAVPPDGDLEATVRWMAEQTHAIEFRVMTTSGFSRLA